MQANNDLSVLEKMGYIKKKHTGTSITWQLVSNDDFIVQLREEDKAALNYIFNTFGTYSSNELIKYTYVNYPFWAINSVILDDLLSLGEKNKILSQKREISEKCLFTIGYEGKSLETYINQLVINNIKVLHDWLNLLDGLVVQFI